MAFSVISLIRTEKLMQHQIPLSLTCGNTSSAQSQKVPPKIMKASKLDIFWSNLMLEHIAHRTTSDF